jgi:hypothetical protein
MARELGSDVLRRRGMDGEVAQRRLAFGIAILLICLAK